MGAINRSDGDVVFQREGVGEVRRIESGPLTVEFGRMETAVDASPLFKGLPDDRCQCHHHGYVVRGQLAFRTEQGVMSIGAGEAFHVMPGHIPLPGAGCEWVQFSETAEQRVTDAVVRRNATAAAAAE